MAEEFQTGIYGGAWWINPSRSSSLSPCSADSSSMVCQSAQKHQQTDSDSGGNSNLQMMNLSSSTDWNQAFLRGNGRVHENNCPTMMLEDFNSKIQKEWNPKSLTSGFPVNSASYEYNSALLQGYFEPDPQLDVQQSVYNNRSMASNYVSTANHGTNVSNEQPPSWPKFAPKRQPGGLHFSNNTHFWNPSAATCLNDNRPGSPATALGEKPNCPIFTDKYNNEEVREPGSSAKRGSSSEPTFKRPRIETPSPLPTFKVRKEKLGDRITALQQLVSPFGKTDTASVLQDAIEYIKFLHDQVSVLTTPYLKQGTPIPQQQDSDHKLKDPGAPKLDIKSRGLCLVPISSTIPVANETTADFWTPTFGATFR